MGGANLLSDIGISIATDSIESGAAVTPYMALPIIRPDAIIG